MIAPHERLILDSALQQICQSRPAHLVKCLLVLTTKYPHNWPCPHSRGPDDDIVGGKLHSQEQKKAEQVNIIDSYNTAYLRLQQLGERTLDVHDVIIVLVPQAERAVTKQLVDIYDFLYTYLYLMVINNHKVQISI